MTDMNISDGAVEAAAEHTPVDKHGQFIAPDWDSILDTVRATLTYFTAHPDELPQEVRDAVLRNRYD